MSAWTDPEYLEDIDLLFQFQEYQHQWLQDHADDYYLKYKDRQEAYLKTITENEKSYALSKDTIDVKNIETQFQQQFGFQFMAQKNMKVFQYPKDNTKKRKTKSFNLEKLKIFIRPEYRCKDFIRYNNHAYCLYDIYRGMYSSNQIQLNIPKSLFLFYFPKGINENLSKYQMVYTVYKNNNKTVWNMNSVALESQIKIVEHDLVYSISIPCTLEDITEGDMVLFGLYKQIPKKDFLTKKEAITIPTLTIRYFNHLPKEQYISIQAYFQIDHTTFNIEEFTAQYLNQSFNGVVYTEGIIQNKETTLPFQLTAIEPIFNFLLLTFQIDQRSIFSFKRAYTTMSIQFGITLKNVNHHTREFQLEYYKNVVQRLCAWLQTQYQTQMDIHPTQMAYYRKLMNVYFNYDQGSKHAFTTLLTHFQRKFEGEDITSEEIKRKFEISLHTNFGLEAHKFKSRTYSNEDYIDLMTLAKKHLHDIYLYNLVTDLGYNFVMFQPFYFDIVFTGIIYTIQKEASYPLNDKNMTKKVLEKVLSLIKLDMSVIDFPQEIMDFTVLTIPDPTIYVE